MNRPDVTIRIPVEDLVIGDLVNFGGYDLMVTDVTRLTDAVYFTGVRQDNGWHLGEGGAGFLWDAGRTIRRAPRVIEVPDLNGDATCEAISLAHCSAIYKAIQAAGLPSAPALDLLARCDRAANYGNTETALHLFHEACTMATDLGFEVQAQTELAES